MEGSILARRDCLTLDNGMRLRLLSALEVLQARREAGELAQEDRERALCSNACLLARALEQECVYAVFRPHTGRLTPQAEDVLTRQGFVAKEGTAPILEVDMHTPTVLIQNLETTIQEPLCQNHRLLAAIQRGHRRLQTALTQLYPRFLVLTLSAGVIHQRLLEMITAYNEVPAVPTEPRKLGRNMCVPYGKMLRGKIVPNTVTKTIHTDRVYSPDLSQSSMEPFPHYPPIQSQIRTIKSFDRPVILVDDLLHSGNRIRALDPLFRQEGVVIDRVLVGLLSGRGRDLMAAKGRSVDSVYFIPNMRSWFVESTMYPFIGGDTVGGAEPSVPGLTPSVNLILPYAFPRFYRECGREAVFRFSCACLENARDILLALETTFRERYARNLTLSRLSEAVILPLSPDKGSCMHYDPSLPASVFLQNDLEMLLRMRNVLQS